MTAADAPITPQGSSETATQPNDMERRRQQRLQVNALAKLIIPHTNRSISALNQEISWGGGIFIAHEEIPPGVDTVLIDLPWVQGQKVSILANILRTTPLEQERHLVVVRFWSLTPESHYRLERLLTTLGGKVQTAARTDPSVLFQSLEVTVGDINECHEILTQIADGRCILRTIDGYDIGQSISLSIWGPNNMPEIRLRARVVDIRKEPKTITMGHDTHLLTIDFEHPIEAITPLIDSLLSRFPQKRSSRGSQGPRPAATGIRAALEREFPGVMNYLTAVWGDHSAFDAFFLELLAVGDAGSGWPAEAWDELLLLRTIHFEVHNANSNLWELVPIEPGFG